MKSTEWINYYRIADMKMILTRIEDKIRFHIRMCYWKQWKTVKNRAKPPLFLGYAKILVLVICQHTKGILQDREMAWKMDNEQDTQTKRSTQFSRPLHKSSCISTHHVGTLNRRTPNGISGGVGGAKLRKNSLP